MSMVIASNLPAVNTRRQFDISGRSMASAMEKLSSGYRINTGKDDPSGLLISEKLRAQLNGLKRAQQNTEEAINVMGIAEGALNEMNSILKKMKSLAIHSANTGVTSPDQVAADQAEMDSAVQTLDRIAQTTRFSGENLLNGAKDIAYSQDTLIKSTQQNSLVNSRESNFTQIFRRADYNVALNFTGSTNADSITGVGDVDFSQQAMKAYVEVDTSSGAANQTQVRSGAFTQEQSFTLTGSKGSRAFRFRQGDTVANMVQQIKTAADSTGIDAALVFNSDQKIDQTTTGVVPPTPIPPTGNINVMNIAIPGMVNKSGVAINLTFSDGGTLTNSDALRAAMEKAGISDFRFSIEVADGSKLTKADGPQTYNLIATDDKGGRYILQGNWNGGTTLDLTGAVADTGGNADVATALQSMTMTASDQVNAANTFSDTSNWTFSWAGSTATIDKVYNANSGATELDLSGVNWKNVYNSLKTDDEKTKLLIALSAGDLKVTFSDPTTTPAGGKMDQWIPTIELSSATVTGGAFTTIALTRSQAGINQHGVTGTGSGSAHVIQSGVLQGGKITITDLAAAGVGFQSKVNANGNSIAAGGVGVGTGSVVLQGGVINRSQSITINSATTTFNSTVDSGMKDATGTASQWTLSGDTTALNNKLGSQSVTLETVSVAGNPNSFIIQARFGDGTVEEVFNGYSGAGGPANKITIASGRLAGLTLENDLAFNAVQSFSADSWNLSIPSGAIKIGTAMFTTTSGEMNVDASGLDLNAIFRNMAVTQKVVFINDLQTNNALKIELIVDTTQQMANFRGTFKLLGTGGTYAEQQYSRSQLGMSDYDGQTSSNGTVLSGGRFQGLNVKVTDNGAKTGVGFNPANAPVTGSTSTAATTTSSGVSVNTGTRTGRAARTVLMPNLTAPQARWQVGGISTDSSDSAARTAGSVTVFNNGLAKDGSGQVEKGVSGVEISALGSASVFYGMNTDGQGRIYVKFTGDNSFELYKDSSLSAESLVATGINGQEIKAANNSGLRGFTLHLNGRDLASQRGVYLSLAGIEGKSTTNITDSTGKITGTQDGVVYNGSVVGDSTAGFEGKALFDASRTVMSGVELGRNTSDDGTIYMKNVYDADKGTVQVFAYRHKDMRDSDMVAKSEVYSTREANPDFDNTKAENATTNPKYLDATSMTVVLNEVRNADNTAGTGLGMALSVNAAAFKGAASATLAGTITFTNLGARVFSQDYGSGEFVKVTQDKGAIFTEYGTQGDNTSARLIDAGEKGTSAQIFGQDATLSVNGMQIKTRGLQIKMATQDIQADFTFNGGRVGSTTIAQVGYGDGSIFTKVGALNLGNGDLAETAGTKYEGLSGLLANAGHVTNERITDFQAGMQLQLGEGAGDQERTVVAIRSMTSENLGRVTKGGYWETGSAVYTERTFSMKDVMGGGMASLSVNPILTMAIIDQAISDVSETRAQLGALQANLLQTNSNNLSVTMENIQRTESGIRDADMAYEMTEFTKQQVLQGAAMSMLTQANQASQSVLQLLR